MSCWQNFEVVLCNFPSLLLVGSSPSRPRRPCLSHGSAAMSLSSLESGSVGS